MMRPLRVSIAIAACATFHAACDDGTRAEAAASRSRDSALAHDLALAGDTATPSVRSDGTEERTVTESPGMLAGSTAAASRNAMGTARTTSNVTTEAGTRPPGPSAEGYVGPSCASPALEDQRRCLLGYLERSDVQLDRSYQALIEQLKREAGTKRGAAEPPAVQRLRSAQRAWLVYRDDECRKRTIDREGPLWAPVRAECLAEYSAVRERELQDALAKRKALAPRTATTKSKPATARKSSRGRSGRRG